MLVYENLHWLRGGGNAWLYEDDGRWVLVDSGMPGRCDPVGYLRQLGRDPQSLTHILITHADIDHAGNAAAVQQATGARVYAGPATAELLTRAALPSHNAPLIDWLSGRFMRYTAVPDAALTVVQPDEMLPLLGGLQALASPGHTADQIVFYSPSRGVLFAGDALNTRGGRVQCSPRSISADYAVARATARRLAALQAPVVACGHGELLTPQPADWQALAQRLAV